MSNVCELLHHRDKEIAYGYLQGIERQSMDIARNMKAKGLPAKDIADMTGLSQEIIESL